MTRTPLHRWLTLAALLPLSGCVGFFRWVDQVLLPEETAEDQLQDQVPGRDPRQPPDTGGADSGWWDSER
jgi:hypothetical protein